MSFQAFVLGNVILAFVLGIMGIILHLWKGW